MSSPATMRTFLLVLIAVCMAPFDADAGHTLARIKEILVYEAGDLVYVYPEGGINEPPACHGSNGNYTSFKLSRPRAREYLEQLSSAMYARKFVRFRTDGACIDQPVSDTLRYFAVLAEEPDVAVQPVGASSGGKVVHVASVGDVLIFNVTGDSERDRPACATSGRFAVHKNSMHASVVLAAFATGKTLSAMRGTGLCRLWGNAEDLRWVEVCPLSGCE